MAKIAGHWPDNPFQVVPDGCLEHGEKHEHAEVFQRLDGEIRFLLDVLASTSLNRSSNQMEAFFRDSSPQWRVPNRRMRTRLVLAD